MRKILQDFTFVFPCLNEEKTIEACYRELDSIAKENGLTYDVILVDNGSTDKSIDIAKSLGIRVVEESAKGYGNTLRRGIRESETDKVLFADCYGSYDLSEIPQFIKSLDEYDFVTGHRKYIDEGAQPWLHRYIGVPALSIFGNILYQGKVPDWHCGLRGLKKSLYYKLDLSSEGMEFASEMLLKSLKNKISIKVIPVRLRKDLRDRKPHLRTFRDGYRHLDYLVKNRFK